MGFDRTEECPENIRAWEDGQWLTAYGCLSGSYARSIPERLARSNLCHARMKGKRDTGVCTLTIAVCLCKQSSTGASNGELGTD